MKKFEKLRFKIEDSRLLSFLFKKHIFAFCLIILYFAIFILEKTEFLSSYYLQIMMFIGINLVMTVSLGMVNGFTGQFSIGHGGFMGIGAYTSIFFTTIIFQLLGQEPLGKSIGGYALFFVSVLVGGGLAGIAGFLIGLPTLNIKGD
ncbi:TPA: hypothetical protein ENS27_07150, partial [bacterium]|nr:hypothetical protein [bacterium]